MVGELFAPFVPIGGCECYCISVRKAFIQIVVSGFTLRKALACLDGLVHYDLDDSGVCIDRVRVFSAVVSFNMHDVVGVFLADEVLDYVNAVEGLGEEVFFSHFVPPFF